MYNVLESFLKFMSHISGTYSYDFSRIDPSWDNSLETGINSLVVGLTCTFSGHDSFDTETTVSRYTDGSTGFDPCISIDYLNNNLQDICNSYASGADWFRSLQLNVSGSIDHPIPVTGFSPSGITPEPPDEVKGVHTV